jgi:hypothetical protein
MQRFLSRLTQMAPAGRRLLSDARAITRAQGRASSYTGTAPAAQGKAASAYPGALSESGQVCIWVFDLI